MRHTILYKCFVVSRAWYQITDKVSIKIAGNKRYNEHELVIHYERFRAKIYFTNDDGRKNLNTENYDKKNIYSLYIQRLYRKW